LPGIGLNAEGVKQAQRLGRHLASNVPLEAVYSSPLQRAHETARIIAGVRQPPNGLKIEERLNEMDFGDWTGAEFGSLQSSDQWRRYNSNRSLHSPPGGESLTQVQARAWDCVSSIAGNHADGAVAVVSHADVIRALLLLFLGMPLDLLLRLQVGPASLSEVLLGGDYPVVPYLNFDCSSEMFHSTDELK
jgi:broad specificity phosphatase PhoE